MVKYYPYLRGKQYELLALRAMCEELSIEELSKLHPIIEPVKRADCDTPMITALSAMQTKGVAFAYIMNPQSGDFENNTLIFFSEEIKSKLNENRGWMPAFILNGDANYLERQVSHIVTENQFEKIILVLPKNEEVSKWNGLISRNETHTIVCCDSDSRSTMRQVRRYNKDIVRLDDCFQAETRNKDFRGKEDQRFNDNVAFYEEDGYAGFGDYTTLPGSFVKGGMLPWVVAIHMTYNKNEEEVWIHHFLSETNDNGTENIQGKFREAAEQIKRFFEQQYPHDVTPAINKLHQYVVDGHYPGLGTLKKISIEHHITLMCRK